MSFSIKKDEMEENMNKFGIWVRVRDMTRTYSQIWDLLKNKLGIKFHSEPVYDKKCLKTKVYDSVNKNKFFR